MSGWRIWTSPWYVPLQSVAETRQWAVNLTAREAEPQKLKLDGVAVRLILRGLLTMTRRVMSEMLGLHVNEPGALPVPVAAAKVMSRGADDQVALGEVA